MSYRHSPLISLVVILAVLVASPCVAQSPPTGLSIDIVSAPQLDANQRQTIEAYADYWTGVIADAESTAPDVERAREELIRPLEVPGGPSATFRQEYASNVVPALDAVIQANGRPHAAMNSMIVLGSLPDRRALTALYNHADSRREARTWIRIGAAANLARSMQTNLSGFNARDIPPVIRNLRNAAEAEDDPIVLLHLLEGMGAVSTQESHEALLTALQNVVQKIDQHAGANCPLIDPLYATMEELRNRYIRLNLPINVQRDLKAQLSGCMVAFLSAAQGHWDPAHADAELTLQWAKAIRLSEAILRISVPVTDLDGIDTDLRQHWEDGDQSAFDADVQQWQRVVPPTGG